MDELRKAAVLTELADRMREGGRWCAETQLQKAVYFLQELFDVPTEFSFILYKHGLFSFGLRDELTSLRADGLLQLRPRPTPYGPTLVATDQSEVLRGSFPKTLSTYRDQISFIAKHLGPRTAPELERLSTALYVIRKAPRGKSVEELAQELTELKPHVSPVEAEKAVKEAQEIIQQAESLQQPATP